MAPKLSEADKKELSVLCRQVHSLLEEEEVALVENPLTTSHIPVSSSAGSVVVLKSIGQTKNVNALADDQTLSFAETGLTIVYGDNGAGKSGYTRVLKHACRARDQEDILPNAYTTPTGKPSAQIRYSVAGKPQPAVFWQDGVPVHPNLSNISVFDSKCAYIHVDGKNELAYTPIPLQLLQGLADICREIGNGLKENKSSLERQIPAFRKKPTSHEGTAVHQLVVGLSDTVSVTTINSLIQMSQLETSRLEQLKRDLASDPAKEIRKLKALKQRAEGLAKMVATSEFVLLPSKADELRQLLKTAEEKSTAAQLAASDAFNKEPLPQAGSEVWKTLWKAARQFSTQEAYPDQVFPNTSSTAVCVLCQQPISVGASARLNTFEKFIQQTVQKIAEDARQAIQKWKNEIKISCIEKESLADGVRLLRDELDEHKLCRKVAFTLIRARARSHKFVATTNPMSLKTPNAISSITSDFTALFAKLDGQIAELQKFSDPNQRKLQEEELHELEDRVWLATIKTDVETEITRLKKITAFKSAIPDTDTNRITRKTTDLSKILVTNIIRDAFTAEITALNIADRKIELAQESGLGATRFKVSLSRNNRTRVASVLSEGEHRCVALAAFLAELSTANNLSGIIFDDPVSSLSHNYRELVANRLVKEAINGRQVIVFTHDIPFLMILDYEARANGQVPYYQSVSRADEYAGICSSGAPLKANTVPELTHKLDNRLATTSVLHTHGRLDEWEDQVKAMAGILRDGWERASEACVAPVTQRFSNKVHPGGLRMLTILNDQDFIKLNEGYGFACEYCHTNAAALNPPTPIPGKIKDEIDRLRNWYNSVSTRQEQKR